VVNRDALAAQVENARAAVRLARIDLANTRITAPRAGRLGEVGVRQGQYVTAGTQLMGLVPDTIWVTANLKETQMRDIRVGQPVELSVDALGGQTLRGHVERIAPAAGSEFSGYRCGSRSIRVRKRWSGWRRGCRWWCGSIRAGEGVRSSQTSLGARTSSRVRPGHKRDPSLRRRSARTEPAARI
jgi:hypothetical protein